MKKIYHGSCHCGAVTYEASLDLSAGTFRCNCSICRKKRNWLAVAAPEDFHLTGGADNIGEYQFASRKLHHLFCKTCGISSYAWGENEKIGTFYAVSVNCLDDASPDELIEAPIAFVDGLHDCYDASPEETRHL
ncbi:hypothetical protein FHS26_000413 [Rhizobium pisi]|uniref:GFA family protein n=3 Tax=Rhizobium TaxID=379 RepID=A0A7W6FJQ3_9HYPH|nr:MULTISPECIES: GFA family protein [Rhizobium]MBB3132718.1 hypothetical protein [Rhizobium pisi]MBB3916518.1 hypothetical protein [Rhizobium fabae]RSB86434.1 GFA family protein [Rhizobium pisi]RUM13195.1 GFA family protein [Rhizobium fabae]RUM27426.1 GFA family protein [Rhizobium vallis]